MSASSDRPEGRGAGRRTVAALLAGRAAFRLAAWLAGLALLAVWGATTFAVYAAALGATGWLITVSASGTEKAALALLPRTPVPALRTLFVRLAAIPLALLVVAGGIGMLVGLPGPLVAAAAYSTAVGATAVLVGVRRLDGAYRWDVWAFTALGVLHVATIGLAAWFDAGPATVLWSLALASAALVIGLLAVEVRARDSRSAFAAAPPDEAPPTAVVLEAVALMGGVEILNTIGIAVVYAVLHASAAPEQSSLMYVLLLVSQAFTGVFLYLLRLAMPRASLSAASDRAAALGSARRLLGWAAITTGVIGAGIAVTTLASPSVGAARWVLVGLALAGGVAGFAVATWASMRLETADVSARRLAAAAALAGLGGVVAAALVLVPRDGALGGLTAMIIGTAVQSAVGWLLVSRAATPSPPPEAGGATAG